MTTKGKMINRDRFAVVEIEARGRSIFKSMVVDASTTEGDVVEAMTDSGWKEATVIGIFRSLVEADVWAERRNCE